MRKSDPILMAAKDAFIENGFGNSSMDDIAVRAATTKRTVYNNFGSKEQLLEAVIDHSIALFEESVPTLDPAPSAAQLDINQISRFCELLLQLMTWRAAIGLQRLIIAEGLAFPHLAERLATRISAAMCQPLSALFKARGLSAALAQKHAVVTVDMLTSKARLDRLLGLRQAYPALPGKNRLDATDRAAIEAALKYLLDQAAPMRRASTTLGKATSRASKVDNCS